MNLTFSPSSPDAVETAVLGALITDTSSLTKELSDLDAKLGGALTREIERGRLRGGKGDVVTVSGGADGPQRVLLIGLGAEHDGRDEAVRVAGSRLAAAMKGARASEATLLAASDARDTELLVEGFALGAYKFDRYKSKKDDADKEPSEVSLSVLNADSAKTQVERALALTQAVNWARDLANSPGNHMKPEQLAKEAASLADEFEHMTCTTLDRAAIEKEGMGLLAGVAQGSFNEPRLIVLEWNPPSASSTSNEERIAFVGKAVTFDTGGISIKPAMGMTEMKMDKSGGCAVIGAMRAIAALNVSTRILAVVGSTENMPDGNAYKPGDVLTALDGTSIEVTNTDAEGRLVLGDAISYARKLGCGKIVELSTLTGAMVIALGHHFAGVIGRSGEWTDAVLASAKRTGDHGWHLPLHEAYKSNLKSDCADMVNSGGRAGGSLYAGLFLEHFAKDTPFVHLDVAGAAMLPKPAGYHLAKGASGWGVRLLTDLAESA